jgi:hypothetical protein
MIEDEKLQLQKEADRRLAKPELDLKAIGKDPGAVRGSVLIGGTLFLLYIAVRKVLENRAVYLVKDLSYNQIVIRHPKGESLIARKIREYITIFLLSLLKERILAYIKESNPRHESLQESS